MTNGNVEKELPIIVLSVSWDRNEPNTDVGLVLNVLTPAGVTATEVFTALNLAQQRLVLGMSNAIQKMTTQLQSQQEGTPDE